MNNAAQAPFTKGQRDFLTAVANGTGGVFHRRVVQPMFDAGYVFPTHGNITFWIVGCNGHGANQFCLTDAGAALFVRKAA